MVGVMTFCYFCHCQRTHKHSTQQKTHQRTTGDVTMKMIINNNDGDNPHTSWAGIYQPFTYSAVCVRRNSV